MVKDETRETGDGRRQKADARRETQDARGSTHLLRKRPPRLGSASCSTAPRDSVLPHESVRWCFGVPGSAERPREVRACAPCGHRRCAALETVRLSAPPSVTRFRNPRPDPRPPPPDPRTLCETGRCSVPPRVGRAAPAAAAAVDSGSGRDQRQGQSSASGSATGPAPATRSRDLQPVTRSPKPDPRISSSRAMPFDRSGPVASAENPGVRRRVTGYGAREPGSTRGD
jgi:hypothetical protein